MFDNLIFKNLYQFSLKNLLYLYHLIQEINCKNTLRKYNIHRKYIEHEFGNEERLWNDWKDVPRI